MAERVFEGHGIEILRRGTKLFLRYDAGRFAIQLKEVEVTPEQAAKAQKGEREAYEVLLEIDRAAR